MTKINKTEYLTDSTLFTNHTSLAVDQQVFDNPEQFKVESFTYIPKDTVKIVSTKHPMPNKATTGAAAYDIRSTTTVEVHPDQTVMVGTGVYLDLPRSLFAMLVPRSGLATKQGITLANSIGIIDSDFTGEIRIALKNTSKQPFIVQDGDRVAQLIFLTYISPDLVSVQAINRDTDRSPEGFGTTGTK